MFSKPISRYPDNQTFLQPTSMKIMTVILILAAMLPAVAEDSNTPQARPGSRRGEPRGFGGPIVLKDDDKPAFPAPPPRRIFIHNCVPAQTSPSSAA